MDSSFKRTISIWQGIALYVGAVVGSGILILPGMTAGIAGENALIAWGVMILLSTPLAYTFAFLAREYPSAGGVSTFVDKAFGRYTGALIGWFYFIAASAGQFIVPLTGGIYVTYVFRLSNAIAYMIAAVLLIGSIVSNYFGIRMSGKVQLATSGLTSLILLCTILFSISHVDIRQLHPTFSGSSFGETGKASMLIFWSFFGWEAIASLAPEFRRHRDITRATLGAIIIVGVLYFGIALAVVGTHSYSMGDQAMNNASLAQVMSNTTGMNGAIVTSFIALIICLGTTNAFVASISRLAYSLSHEKLAPSFFDHINEGRSTPQRAVLLVAVLAGIGLLTSFAFHISMSKLVYIPNSLGIATYILGTAAGVKLIRSLIGKVFAGIACAFCLVAYPFVGTSIGIPIFVAILCVVYVAWRTKTEKTNSISRLFDTEIGKPNE